MHVLLLSAGVGIEHVQLSHVPFDAMNAVTGVSIYPTVFIILEIIARTTQSASTRLQVLHMVSLLNYPAISNDAALGVSSVPALLPVLGAVVSSSKAAAQTRWLSGESACGTATFVLTVAGQLLQTAGLIVGKGGTTTGAYEVPGEEQQHQQQQEGEEDCTDCHKQQGQGGGRLGAQSKQQVAWYHLEAAAQQWLQEMRPSLRLDGGRGQQLERWLKEPFWVFLWTGLLLVYHATSMAFPWSMQRSLNMATSEVKWNLQQTVGIAADVLGYRSGAVLLAVKELQNSGAESLGSFARMVLSMVPVGFCCNNPDCRELGGLSDLGLVQGLKGARGVCGGCGLACYCSRNCQEKVWSAHRNVCR